MGNKTIAILNMSVAVTILWIGNVQALVGPAYGGTNQTSIAGNATANTNQTSIAGNATANTNQTINEANSSIGLTGNSTGNITGAGRRK